jgi:tetrahydromethanopterin S-methyltransferase subunit A
MTKTNEPKPEQLKDTRMAFMIPDDAVAAFKIISIMKRLTLEELGDIAIRECIQKNKSVLKEFSMSIE